MMSLDRDANTRTRIKICGVCDNATATAAVDAGADAIGFVFAASPRRVTPARAAEISNTVPDTIKKVAVMLHPSNEQWRDVLARFSPDVLQTDAGDFDALDVPDHIECWPVYREKKVADPFLPGKKGSATYLYEGAKSGQGETVDWHNAARVAKQGRMILAGGLDAGNVAAAIATVGPYGVDVSSGVESAPGEKEPALIREFIKAARAAGNDL